MDGSEKKLGFGCMRFPLINKDDQTSIDIEKLITMVDYFMSHGFTYFDTAFPYHKGESEKALKKVLVERYPREAYTITDKMTLNYIKKPEDMETFFKSQLEHTGLDYFDYYWLHAMNKERIDYAEKIGAFDFFKQKKKEGKIHHIGFSFHDTADVLEDILKKHPEAEVVQLQINYEDWDNAVVQSRLNYEVAVKYHKKVAIMEPVKGGRLAMLDPQAEKLMKNKEPSMSCASWAIRFAASLDDVLIVLSGMSDLEQVKDNVSYMKDFKPLNQEEKSIVKQVQDIIKKNLGIPCTGCRYCYDGCPKHIDIPTYFSLYNYVRIDNPVDKGVYKKACINHGKASECLKCGQCEKQCPQHLHIRDLLAKVAEKFE